MWEALDKLNGGLLFMFQNTTVTITPEDEEQKLPHVFACRLEGGQLGDFVIVEVGQGVFTPWLGSSICDGIDLGSLIDCVDILLRSGCETSELIFCPMGGVLVNSVGGLVVAVPVLESEASFRHFCEVRREDEREERRCRVGGRRG